MRRANSEPSLSSKQPPERIQGTERDLSQLIKKGYIEVPDLVNFLFRRFFHFAERTNLPLTPIQARPFVRRTLVSNTDPLFLDKEPNHPGNMTRCKSCHRGPSAHTGSTFEDCAMSHPDVPTCDWTDPYTGDPCEIAGNYVQEEAGSGSSLNKEVTKLASQQRNVLSTVDKLANEVSSLLSMKSEMSELKSMLSSFTKGHSTPPW